MSASPSNLKLAAAASMSLLVAACGGASSPEALGEETFARLKKNDFQGYFEGTVVTAKELVKTCPLVQSFVVDQAKFQKRFNECRGRLDFANAKLVKAVASGSVVSTLTCGGSNVAQALRVAVTVSTPTQIYTFFVDDDLETSSGWKTTNELKCP